MAEKTGKVMQQDTLKHVALAVMDPETKEKMLDHLAEDSYEELKARVFKYLVHVKGITYEEPKAWGAQLNHTGGQANPQDQSSQDGDGWGDWSHQETLSALMALKGKGKGKGPGKGGGACHNCGKEGHWVRECPEEPRSKGSCYGCGETGHIQAYCPNGPGKRRQGWVWERQRPTSTL